MHNTPLKFLITRAHEDAILWQKAIEALGHRGLIFPCIEVHKPDPSTYLPQIMDALPWADWVTITSKRSVTALPPLPKNIKIAAVGPTSAEACRTHLGRVDLTSGGGHAKDLALDLLALPIGLRPQRVLFPRGTRSMDVLSNLLKSAGIGVRECVVYDVSPLVGPQEDLALLDGVNYILIGSPTAAEGLVRRFRGAVNTPILSIGPTSSRAARSLGLNVVGEAKKRGLDGLLECIPKSV